MESLQIDPTDQVTHFGEAAHVMPAASEPYAIVVCEHASNHVPELLGDLGLERDILSSHVAWDPGALGVARHIARHMGAVLVSGAISRLVYDCNRPPEAASAIPETSEIYDIPGNRGLSAEARAARVANVYVPFSAAVTGELHRHAETLELLVTVHSFTPVYHGRQRQVELGLLHGRDARFCHAMMAQLPARQRYDTRINEPYSAADGVAHTLDLHGCDNGLWNVMIEIRNDLIRTADQQAGMAAYLAEWITATLQDLRQTGGAS
jgi:predicted N-formylglutamate amidohydrolase